MAENTVNLSLHGDNLISIPPIREHLLRSDLVQQTFRIQVMQPARRHAEQRRYPVIYITEANCAFDMCKSISYLLQLSEQDAPPFILVGIGYPGESPFAGTLLRDRDFTFPPFPLYTQDEMNADSLREYVLTESRKPDAGFFEGTLLPESGAKTVSGGEDFRRFIGDQVIPFIDSNYPTDHNNRTYFGHSVGGWFGLFTLFTQPELFHNYIASSPTLLYNGKGSGSVVYNNYNCGERLLQAFLALKKTMPGRRRLYMSVGSEEDFQQSLGDWKLSSGFYQFAELMKNSAIPGLDVMTELFPGEGHITVLPTAFIHGVQAMLGTRRVTRSVYF